MREFNHENKYNHYWNAVISFNMPSLTYCEEEINFEIKLDGIMLLMILHMMENYVWCATNSDGVVLRYNKTDGTYIKYTTENGLPSNIVLQ